ncbi:MAG: hypothetical protein EOO19_04830 [Chryseobacterium sp.]|nr:MAG: hypothetical protein EOO19_04830 [Chryseobacterium sp.]
MVKDDIKRIITDFGLPITITSLTSKRSIVKINRKIAIPVQLTSSYYETNLDIAIFNEDDDEIGTLCFTKELSETPFNEYTENQVIAFLTEAAPADLGSLYQFKYNYLVVASNFYENYLANYASTSPIWGGFTHDGATEMVSHKINISRIDLKSLNISNSTLKENALRSIFQPFAFERYLKLYHLLELRFDSEIIDDIKQLDYDTSSETIAEILNNYSKTEIVRLNHIIDKYCTDIPSIVKIVDDIEIFQSLAKSIFYKFGKESNPLKEEDKFERLCISGFDFPSVKSLNISGVKDVASYEKFVKKLISYWIYRVRSSIAHSRIGEYILGYNDEDFIAEFAEPLIKQVILQAFKK